MKLDRGQPPIILSEIIISGENGCCGGNIPISHFLLSLTHSALGGDYGGELSERFFSGLRMSGSNDRRSPPLRRDQTNKQAIKQIVTHVQAMQLCELKASLNATRNGGRVCSIGLCNW